MFSRPTIDRRQIVLGAGLLPLLASPLRADEKLQTIHFGLATKAISPIIINILLPEYLGYYREEGLKLDCVALGSNAAAMASLDAGRVDVCVGTPAFEIPIVARGEALSTVNYYEYTYPFKWAMAVTPDGPITDIAQLKGKRIGVSGLGQTDYPVGRTVVSLAGLNPDKDVSWLAVGEGVTAGIALQRGDIDGLFYFDTGFGTIEAAGIKLRYLALPPNVPKVGGLYMATTRAMLQDHRAWCVGFGRAVAKASLFIQVNPEAAAYGFIQMYPEAAPKAKSLPEQIAAIVAPIKKRAPLYSCYDKSVTKWGYIKPSEWQEELAFAGVADKIKDPSIFFTDALIDEINQFDPAAVRQKAQNFKIP